MKLTVKLAVAALALAFSSYGGPILAQTDEEAVLSQRFEFVVENSLLGEIKTPDASELAIVYAWGLKVAKDGQVKAFFLERHTGDPAPADTYWLDDAPVSGLYHRETPEGQHEIFALDTSHEPVVCAVRKGFWGRNFSNAAWVLTPNCELRLEGLGSQEVSYTGRGWNLKKKQKTRVDSRMRLTVVVKPS